MADSKILTEHAEPMVVLSTAHISSGDADALVDGTSPVIAYDHGREPNVYGHMIHVPSAVEEGGYRMKGHTREFRDLIELVDSEGYVWLLLDSGATQHPDLATFNW